MGCKNVFFQSCDVEIKIRSSYRVSELSDNTEYVLYRTSKTIYSETRETKYIKYWMLFSKPKCASFK